MESKNVLIVDDDEAILDLFNLVGKKLGLNVVVAENGYDAFKTFGYMDYFMAITDLNMPKTNGIELIKKVRNIPKYRNFPFLIITGNLADFDSEVAFLERVEIKEKPIDKDYIEEIFKKNLEIHDENAKLINEKELLKSIVENLIEPSELLLKVMTKSSPSSEEVKVKKKNQFFSADYFAVFPTFIAGNKISFVFSFEKTLATQIQLGVTPNNSDPANTPACLLKAITPMLIKLFEKIGQSLDYSNNNQPLVFGCQDSPSIYTYDYGEVHKSLKVTNEYGAMQVYLIYED
ncbi:MAG: response regulator [Bacteriovoracaceae bacterium]